MKRAALRSGAAEPALPGSAAEAAPGDRPGPAVARELTALAERCIHCGLCLEDCPTYLQLGNEMDSPRGRILLMRGWAEGRAELTSRVRTHLDRCLDCRACETACPSGVQYGALLEHVRAQLPATDAARGFAARLRDALIFAVLPQPPRLRAALWLGSIAERFGLTAVATTLFPALAPLMRMLPRPEAHRAAAPRQPARSAPDGPPRAPVQLFSGCATAVLTPGTLANARRVLVHNGCTVGCPAAQVCCGAIHHHGGRIADARRFARANIDAFIDAEPQAAGAAGQPATAPPAIITIAAGCGAMLRQYEGLLADDARYAGRARDFSRRVRDVSEFLWARGPRPPGMLPAGIPRRVTYHDPCHLIHAQRVADAPRALLRLIPGLDLVECREASTCCGAAGTYNLLQPQIAAELGRRKLANLAATGAATAATGNIGCILHLRALAARSEGQTADSPRPTDACGAPPHIVHTIDLLHAAYGLGECDG